MNPILAPIFGIDPPFQALVSAGAGAGASFQFSRPLSDVSMQIVLGVGVSAAKVHLEGTIDGTHWFKLATFDTSSQGASGDIISSSATTILAARANVESITGGTVSATIVGNPYA